MTEAYKIFEKSITDSEKLLAIFDDHNVALDIDSKETLKRSSLVMVVVAWETYIEDLVTELLIAKLDVISGSKVGRYIERALDHRVKTLHNPNSLKVKQLFEEFFEVDITEGWEWNNYDAIRVRATLNTWLSLRGEAVHRARAIDDNTSLIRRDELLKCIRFFKELVRITDEQASRL